MEIIYMFLPQYQVCMLLWLSALILLRAFDNQHNTLIPGIPQSLYSLFREPTSYYFQYKCSSAMGTART